MKHLLPFALAFLFLATAATAQTIKSTEAVFFEVSPQLDGDLSDACWQQLSPLGEFVTTTPVFGNTPQSRTEARVFYGPAALYIGVRCHVAAGLRDDRGLRDDHRTGDWIKVGLDTWNDGRLSFDFIVTAAGVQSDSREGASWDAIWQSAVIRHADGWTAEIRIPYTALRFPKKAIQDWGFQLTRFDPVTGESSTWSPQNPLVGDETLQFGKLTGLKDLSQERRLSAAVHLGGDFDDSKDRFVGNVGVDGRIGLNSSTTLDFTIVPPRQFDPPALSYASAPNMSWSDGTAHRPRQFDAEEAGLFFQNSLRSPSVRPQALLWRLFVDTTQLTIEQIGSIRIGPSSKVLQSSKLTTRRGDWRLGVAHSLLGPVGVDLVIIPDSVWSRRTLQRLSHYNVVSLERVLPNNGYVNLSNGTLLAGPDYRSLAPSLDFQLRDRSNQYELRGSTNWAHDLLAPGAENVRLQHRYDIRLARVNRNWGWHVQHRDFRQLRNPPFENFPTQGAVSDAGISYRSFRPGGRLLNRSAGVGVQVYQSTQQGAGRNLYGHLRGRDRRFQLWNIAVSGIPYARLVRYQTTFKHLDRRVGPSMNLAMDYLSDSRKRLIWNAGVHGSRLFRTDQSSLSVQTGATWVPARQWSLQANVRMSRDYEALQLLNGPVGWVFERYEGRSTRLDLTTAWFPAQNWRVWLNCAVSDYNRHNRENVELNEAGNFIPHSAPLTPYRLSETDRISFNTGFQHYFSNISQIRFQIGHELNPVPESLGIGLPRVYNDFEGVLRVDLGFVWFLSANR